MLILSLFLTLMASSSEGAQSRGQVDELHKIILTHLPEHPDSARLLTTQALHASEQLNYAFGKANSYFLQSHLYLLDEKLGESFTLNLQALKLLQELDSKQAIILQLKLYQNTGEILRRHYKYDEAIQYYDMGLDVAQKSHLNHRFIDLLYNKGFALMEKGMLDEAKVTLLETLALSKEIGYEWVELNSLNLLGLIHQQLEFFDIARSYFKNMQGHQFDQEDIHDYRGLAYLNIGDTYLKENRFEDAEFAYQNALIENHLFGSTVELFYTQIQLIKLYAETENHAGALEVGKEAVEGYSQVPLSPENYKVFDVLTQVCFAQQDYETARLYYNRYLEENEKFLASQQEILQQSNQFKMDSLTDSFFQDLEKKEKLARLNYMIWFLLASIFIAAVGLHIRKIRFRKGLERELRQLLYDPT